MKNNDMQKMMKERKLGFLHPSSAVELPATGVSGAKRAVLLLTRLQP
jgi:hypothetical protein